MPRRREFLKFLAVSPWLKPLSGYAHLPQTVRSAAQGAGHLTELDYIRRTPGYFDSPWPVECGGSRRQKIAGTPGLNIRPNEMLSSTTRNVGGWTVMFVRRGPGELYLTCGAGRRAGEPRFQRREDNSAGWVERVDPITLATIDRSPDLPSGGWIWCGAIVVHANGDLYNLNGRFVHRLDRACKVVVERALPVDGPHNGLLILPDGNLLVRNLPYRPAGDGSTELGVLGVSQMSWIVLEPERLQVVDEFFYGTPTMGRFSADTNDGVTHVYFTTPTEVGRLIYADGRLSLDPDWKGSYAVAEGQSDAWDSTVGAGSVWFMDMGRGGTASQRAFRFSIANPADRDVIDVIGKPGARNPGPPLFEPVRKVLVHYDSNGEQVVAHRYHGPGQLELLWERNFLNNVQMMCWADTGELVVEDAPAPPDDGGVSADLVVLDIETGQERGRAPIGMGRTGGMFCCPGFGRDVYVCGGTGGGLGDEGRTRVYGIARVYVDDTA